MSARPSTPGRKVESPRSPSAAVDPSDLFELPLPGQAVPTAPAQPPSPRPRSRPRIDEQASELLFAIGRILRAPGRDAQLPRRLKELVLSGGLSHRHLTAFALVSLYGPLSVSELAAREGIAVSTASLLVTQLAAVGLVERREDDDDRRVTVVSVAPAHRRASEAVLETRLAPLRRALELLGPERAEALVADLTVIAEELKGQ